MEFSLSPLRVTLIVSVAGEFVAIRASTHGTDPIALLPHSLTSLSSTMASVPLPPLARRCNRVCICRYLLCSVRTSELPLHDRFAATHPLQANQAFAARLASVLQPGDLVWVHDYHLLLVPRLLRAAMGERGADQIIGLFVHTPFPSSEVFRCLPRALTISSQ